MKARTFYLTTMLVVASLAIFVRIRALAAEPTDAPGATYTNGILHANIPYRAPHAGAGKLTVVVLDPEDHVIGSSEHRVDVAAGKS